MRILTISAAVTLALASGAFAAVATVPTGDGAAVVVERPDLAERKAWISPTPLKPFPIRVFASIVAQIAHHEACEREGFSDTADCPPGTIFAPPNDIAADPTGTTTPKPIKRAIEVEDRVVERQDPHNVNQPANLSPTTLHIEGQPAQTSPPARLIERQDQQNVTLPAQQTSPPPNIGSGIASIAHSIACSKMGLLNAFCGPTNGTAPPKTRRDELVDARGLTTTSWTTIQSTSTVASTTIISFPRSDMVFYNLSGTSFALVTSVPGINAPKINLETEHTSTTVTNPTDGVSIVDTTVLKTVTYSASGTDVSGRATAPCASNTQASESCISNTSIDTQSYLNISTWSNSEFTYSPESTSYSLSPFFNAGSTANPANSTEVPTTQMTTSATGTGNDLGGSSGAVTTTVGSAAGKSINLAGFHLPAAMVAGMAACLTLALFL